MENLWMQDIMTQKFIDSDMTRIMLLYAMTSESTLKFRYKRKNILEYIYRMYADNQNICAVNPNSKIRNINRYGINDIKEILDHALLEWDYYSVNHILKFDNRYINLDLGNEEDKSAVLNHTIQITKMLQKKYFALEIVPVKQIDVNTCREDTNLDVFGKSIFRNRVFEDMQYCPLCEEVKSENLVVVHILPAQWCCSDDELTDKNNGLIMCKEHAKEYISEDFYFKETGFVKNIKSKTVTDMMHLSLEIKNKERRKFISKYLKKRMDSGEVYE